jgi:hypothetical protein
MLGLKEICSLFAAGGLGATSVVAVQQVRPTARPAARHVVHRPQPRPAPPVAAPSPRLEALDCPPAVGALGAGLAALPASAMAAGIVMPPSAGTGFPGGGGAPDMTGSGGLFPPGGGPGWTGGGGKQPGEQPTAAVPEPASWAMMVSGFGLVGLALRRVGAPRHDRPEEGQAARAISAGPKNS